MTLRMQRSPLSTRGLPLFSHFPTQGAKQETAMGDFCPRCALESRVIDAYVSERPSFSQPPSPLILNLR